MLWISRLFFGIAAFFTAFALTLYVNDSNVQDYTGLAGLPKRQKVFHIQTPDPVRSIYMTAWVGNEKKWRKNLLDFIVASEINAIVIDVKDYTGHVLFDTRDPYIKQLDTENVMLPDLREWINTLHQAGVYVIARIAVFQDPVYSMKFPDQAVQTQDGQVWQDFHGLSFVDPAAKPFWKYIVHIANACEQAGFDELNFDYIRFPTDGNLKVMKFPLSKNTEKRHVLGTFFSYLSSENRFLNITTSADLFGMVLTNQDDLSIGQVLEIAEPHFDYICPMIYPSHYPHGFIGIANPAEKPYEVIHYVLQKGSERLEQQGVSRQKIRPWLQDFNLGARYTPEMVRAQITASEELGLKSWMMWDAANHYTRPAYKPARSE